MLHDQLILFQASSLLDHKNTIKICHCVHILIMSWQFLGIIYGDSFRVIVFKLLTFSSLCQWNVSPPNIFLTFSCLCMVESGPFKSLGGKSEMMCGITCLKGFGQIDHLMVVCLMVVCSIVHSMTSFKFWMTKNPKNFQALIVKNN
jgi:hypothetical protein